MKGSSNMPAMRPLLGILSLLFAFNSSYAQFEYAYNNAESFKILKVKNICVYHYNSKLDSFLMSESKLDTGGKLMVQLTYSEKSSSAPISKDTFFYNLNGLLVKKTSFDNQRISLTAFFEYDSIGRLRKQIITGDSVNATSSILYDKDGRHSTIIFYFNSNNQPADTTIDNRFFNKKGQLIRSELFSKSAGTTTVTTRTYNRAGKMTETKTDSPESCFSSVIKYTDKGEISKSSSTYKSTGRVIQSELHASYYPNGLIFQREFYNNNKFISEVRIYYTFY